VRSVAVASERGVSLVEVLVAVAIVAIVVSAFLAALSTGTLSVGVVRERVTAENLARSQLEYTKNYTYTYGATSYPTIAPSTGCSITIGVSYWFSSTQTFTSNPDDDSGIQWITVTISHKGEPVFAIENYKVDR